MAKEELIQLNGNITEVLPDNKYKVKLENDYVILAYIGGKMVKNNIRVFLGNTVIVEVSPYDLTKGRIIYRK